MEQRTQFEPNHETFLPQPPRFRQFIIALLFLAALGIRLPYIDRIEYDPCREYRSALTARGYYFETLESIPEWKRQVAIINRQEIAPLEPTILELLASIGYRLIGGEHLWVPQMLSSLFWLIGGAFLYMLARKVVSTDEAVLCIAFYLFFPYGVYGSRSFMPEPLMIMTILCSIFTIFQYYEKPTEIRLLIAASVSGMSMLVKPFGLFTILGVFVAHGIFKKGVRKLITDRHFLMFLIISVLIPLVYYSYSYITSYSIRRATYENLGLYVVLQPHFWASWVYQIYLTVGFPAFILGLIGALFFHQGLSRATLIGLYGGYFTFCMVYIASSWDGHYHLILVPIIALSIAPIGFIFIKEISERVRYKASGLGLFLLCVLVSMISCFAKLRNPYPLAVDVNEVAKEVKIAQEVGQLVAHSAKTIYLDAKYWGWPLMYYGELAGRVWPHKSTTKAYDPTWQVKGWISPEERLSAFSSEYLPEYFIITDLDEYKKQAELRQLLTQKFPILAQTDDYLIFDLREASKR